MTRVSDRLEGNTLQLYEESKFGNSKGVLFGTNFESLGFVSFGTYRGGRGKVEERCRRRGLWAESKRVGTIDYSITTSLQNIINRTGD